MADVRGIVQGTQSIAVGAFLDILPPVGEEWMIANIYHGGAAELYKYDGVNSQLIDDDVESGAWLQWKWFVVRDNYLRVKNVSGAAALISYEGVRTK